MGGNNTMTALGSGGERGAGNVRVACTPCTCRLQVLEYPQCGKWIVLKATDMEAIYSCPRHGFLE